MLFRTCTLCKRKYLINEKCKTCIKSNNEKYDRFKRNQNSKIFYNSKQWKKISTMILNRFNYLDIYELKVNNRIIKADVVHHIEPILENSNRMLDVHNLIPLSIETHNKVHRIYDKSDDEKKELQRLLFDLIRETF